MHTARNRRKADITCQAGLTLIELMTVLVIMAILAGIAQVSYREFIIRAKRTEGKAALMRLLQQQERYYSLHNSYIAFSSDSTDEDEKMFKWYSGESASSSAYEIKGEACPGDLVTNCLRLTAKPGTPKVDVNFKDPHCGKLIVTSMGTKDAENDDCWK